MKAFIRIGDQTWVMEGEDWTANNEGGALMLHRHKAGTHNEVELAAIVPLSATTYIFFEDDHPQVR